MKKFKMVLPILLVLTMIFTAMPASAVSIDTKSTANSRSYNYKVTTASRAYRDLDDDEIVFVSPSTTCLVSGDKISYQPSKRIDSTYKIHEVWTAKRVRDLDDYSDNRKVLMLTSNNEYGRLRAGQKIKINYKLVAIGTTSSSTPVPSDPADDWYEDTDIYIDMRGS